MIQYKNTGFARATQVTVTRKINGVVRYTQEYDILKIGNVSIEDVEKMNEDNYYALVYKVCEEIKKSEPDLDINYEDAIKQDIEACPLN